MINVTERRVDHECRLVEFTVINQKIVNTTLFQCNLFDFIFFRRRIGCAKLCYASACHKCLLHVIAAQILLTAVAYRGCRPCIDNAGKHNGFYAAIGKGLGGNQYAVCKNSEIGHINQIVNDAKCGSSGININGVICFYSRCG